MRKIILFLLVILFGHTALADRPIIGCEPYNSTVLHCWNNGTIETDTFFTINENGLQMCNNNTDRLNWGEYRQGLYFKQGDNHIFIDFDDLPGITKSWFTDNETYYMLNFSAYLTYYDKEAFLQIIISQNVSADHVQFNYSISTVTGFHNLDKDILLWHGLIDINIGNDNDTDTGSVDITGHALNFSSIVWSEASNGFIKISDRESDEGIKWRWYDGNNRTVVVLPQAGHFNNKVFWFRNISSVQWDNNKTYSMSEYWIDIPECTFSCPPGCNTLSNFRMRCSEGGAFVNCTNQASRNMTFNYWIYFTDGFEFSCACEPSGGCLVSAQENSTGEWLNITGQPMADSSFNYDAENYVCLNRTYSECDEADWWQPNPFSSYRTQFFEVECRKNLPNTSANGIHINFRGWLWAIDEFTTNDMDVYCMNDTQLPSVVIESPFNNSNFTVLYANNTFNITCWGFDDYPLANITLMTNFTNDWTKNYSVNAFPFINFTLQQNLTNIAEGTYSINCNVTDNNGFSNFNESNITFTVIRNCNYPDSGNWILNHNVICVDEDFIVVGNIEFGNWNATFINSTMHANLAQYYISGSYMSQFIGDKNSMIL